MPGTGAVDPFSGSAIVDIDLDNSTSLTALLETVLPSGSDPGNPNNSVVDPTTDLNPYDNDPNIDNGGITSARAGAVVDRLGGDREPLCS